MNSQRTWALALLALLIPGSTPADTLALATPAPGSLAFARYITSIHRRDPFTESGPVTVMIEASLPSHQKESRLLAIREIGESERTEYRVIENEGDSTVMQEVIEPYLAEQKQIEDLPLSSVIITPTNYKFRFMGQAAVAGACAYVFRIEPKKKREGLIRGELWLDSETGIAILQAGHFVKTSSSGIRRIEMIRDTKLRDGSPYSRITRIAVETRHSGRGYLTITEFPSARSARLSRPANTNMNGTDARFGSHSHDCLDGFVLGREGMSRWSNQPNRPVRDSISHSEGDPGLALVLVPSEPSVQAERKLVGRAQK